MALGCGGSTPEATSAESRATDTAAAEAPPPRGALWRSDVDQTVERGLGYFLQRLEVAPSFAPSGSFQGFKIVELYDAGFWEGVDLRAGDIVTRVNGQSIEREGQAYEVFQALKQAPALNVQFLRDGQPRTLSYRIVSPAGAAPEAPKAPAAASGASEAPKAPPAKRGTPQSSTPKPQDQVSARFTRRGGSGERSIGHGP